MVRIGINPLTWTNDDLPELGEANSLETCLTEAKQAGYEGVELGRKFPRDAAVLGPILKEHKLDLVSGWYSARLLERSVEDEIKAMQPHADAAQVRSARKSWCSARCRAACTAIARFRCRSGRSWRRRNGSSSASGWTQSPHALEKQGLKMAYHHHMGTVIQAEDEVDRMMDSTKNVGLLLDSGHLTFAGGDPMRALKRHAKRIVHVHCKDIRKDKLAAARKQDMSFLDAVLGDVFAVPGDGSIDFAPLLRRSGKGRLQRMGRGGG